jgi:hypothetical protein
MIENIFKLLLSPMSYGKPGDTLYVHGTVIFVLPFFLVSAAIFVGSLTWLYLDAERRGKSRIIAILFILLTGWPASFIWWLWLRPPLRGRL